MLWLKLLSTFVLMAVLILEYCADASWKGGKTNKKADKATDKNKSQTLRKAIFALGLVAGFVSLIVTYVEETRAEATEKKNEDSLGRVFKIIFLKNHE